MNQALLLKAASVTRDPDKRAVYMHRYRAGQLRERILACTQCQLSQVSAQRVPWSGQVPSPVAVVGEAPGRVEDLRGEPFVGKAGDLLRNALEAVGFQNYVLMNTICCRPPSNDYTYAQKHGAPEACRPWFEAQLQASGAWLVIVAGGAALKATLGLTGISSLRGKPKWAEGRLWLPVKHPAWYLRNRDKSQELYGDLAIAHNLMSGRDQLPFKPRDEQWGTLKDLPQKDVKAIMDGNDGWVLVYSHVLQEQVVVVRTEDTPVPDQLADLVRYSLEEMVRMREVGKGKRLPREQLRTVHFLKQELGAQFIGELA